MVLRTVRIDERTSGSHIDSRFICERVMITSAQFRCTYNCCSRVIFLEMVEYRFSVGCLYSAEFRFIIIALFFQGTIDIIDTLTSTICIYNALLCRSIGRCCIEINGIKCSCLQTTAHISKVNDQGRHTPGTVLQHRNRKFEWYTICTSGAAFIIRHRISRCTEVRRIFIVVCYYAGLHNVICHGIHFFTCSIIVCLHIVANNGLRVQF